MIICLLLLLLNGTYILTTKSCNLGSSASRNIPIGDDDEEHETYFLKPAEEEGGEEEVVVVDAQKENKGTASLLFGRQQNT